MVWSRSACGLLPYTTLFRSSELLGGWVLRGVNGLTGEGSADFVLGASAGPRSNGTYVIADGVSGVTQVSQDRKSTRLNSSHSQTSYAVYCWKKKTQHRRAHD